MQDGKVEVNTVSSRLGKKTLELEHISKGFGGRELIHDFSYAFRRQDRIGFVGANGCGKTTMMKMIMGIEEPDEGHKRREPRQLMQRIGQREEAVGMDGKDHGQHRY